MIKAGAELLRHYAELTSGAANKLDIAINQTHLCVFNIEPRVDDPWKLAEPVAEKAVAS